MKTSCFAAIFKLFALLFSNFDEFPEINQIYPVPQQAGQKVSNLI